MIIIIITPENSNNNNTSVETHCCESGSFMLLRAETVFQIPQYFQIGFKRKYIRSRKLARANLNPLKAAC